MPSTPGSWALNRDALAHFWALDLQVVPERSAQVSNFSAFQGWDLYAVEIHTALHDSHQFDFMQKKNKVIELPDQVSTVPADESAFI